jgi:hypothetical protein
MSTDIPDQRFFCHDTELALAEAAMWFLVGLVLIIGGGVFFWASQHLDRGVHWAEEVCRQSQTLCHSAYWLMLAGGAAISFAFARKAFKF